VARPTPSDYAGALAAITVGRPERLDGAVELVEHDPAWPGLYRAEEARIAAALGSVARRVEHVGSTAVPGLPAKPVIDVVVEVPDSGREDEYVPALEAAGYTLRIREPDWLEHRLLRRESPRVNVHVFGAGCAEVETMLRFRDRLRADRADRELYARVKRDLAARRGEYLQQYADAKGEVVAAILRRA
jgi:GrpB-like predicted nucleotidyltransferase (UPF0157 family)